MSCPTTLGKWRNDVFIGQAPVNTVTATRDAAASQPSAEMVGLTTSHRETPRRSTTDFAMYFVQFGDSMIFRIYESGIFRKTVGVVSVGDEMTVQRSIAGTIEYFWNSALVFRSDEGSTRELFFQSSFWSQAFGNDEPQPSGHTVVAS